MHLLKFNKKLTENRKIVICKLNKNIFIAN